MSIFRHGEIRLRLDNSCSVDGCIRPARIDGVCSECWRLRRSLRSEEDPTEKAERLLESLWSLPARVPPHEEEAA